MASTAELLVDAETAQHRLLTGTAVVEVRDQNGEMIKYQLANADKLAAYIGQLREAGRRRPLSIRFNTSKGV